MKAVDDTEKHERQMSREYIVRQAQKEECLRKYGDANFVFSYT